jgi:DNA-binding transcriptional LysR family regulator
MLSWDDFRYVKAIADTGSLSGAAAALGVNHSTVFRRLGTIEQRLGSRLFTRGRGGYALTPSGEEMVELAERVGEDITAFERKVTGRDLRPTGELRVTTSDMVLLYLLSEVLVGFRRAYPEIIIDVRVSNTIVNLSKRDADVAVRATYHAPESLTGRRVGRIAWAVYGARALAGTPFDLATDPAGLDWVTFADHISVARVPKWLKEHGVGEERIVYRINTLLGLAEAVAGGAGLAVLPCFIGDTASGLTRLCPALPELEGELWLLTHPDLRNTARVRSFLDFCGAEMAKRRRLLECLT